MSPVPECTVTLPGDGEQGVQSGNTENLSSRSIEGSQGVTGSILAGGEHKLVLIVLNYRVNERSSIL